MGPQVYRRIAALLTAPNGYSSALRYLKRQYGSADKVARCQIYELLRLPACRSGDYHALQTFADQLHAAVVILRQSGLDHDLKGSANLEQAVQKLPLGIRARWARFALKRSPVDLEDLDRFLEETVEAELKCFLVIMLRKGCWISHKTRALLIATPQRFPQC